MGRSECILCLLCRCCFDRAIEIFLRAKNKKKNKMDNLFASKIFRKQDDKSEKYKNAFLCLSQSRLHETVTNTKRMHEARANIFRMLCDSGRNHEYLIKEIQKAILQKDEPNGCNSMEYALQNNFQSLYNEMKQFISS